MKTRTSDGIEIYYQKWGGAAAAGSDKPVLLLMPAWCMSHNGWADLPETLAVNHEVYALDWRGHGQSQVPSGDFGSDDLVTDALAVIEASGAKRVIPVTQSHSGWVGVELRKKLGDRVSKLIHTDWIVLPPPPPYMDLVHALAAPESWQGARETLFSIWLQGCDNDRLTHFIRDEMGGYGADTWMRSGREIGACYVKGEYPLKALASLQPPVPTLHLYSQPGDPEYLAAQEQFAQANPWYHVHKLTAHSHFPTFEAPEEMTTVINDFVAS